MSSSLSQTNKENVQPLVVPEKRKFFATPTVKLNKSVVRGRGTKRNGISKAGLNISHTSMMYKQSLKANNKNLAKALDLSKQDLAALAKKVLELEQEKQEQAAKISVLRTLTDQSSEAVEAEIQRRMKLRLEQQRRKLEKAAHLLHMAGDELHEVIVLCDHQPLKNIDEIVKDTLELTQMCTPDNFAMQKAHRLRSFYPPSNNPVATVAPNDHLSCAEADDTDNRLSIVNESLEAKRKSSLKHPVQADLTSVSMDLEDEVTVPVTRSKRRTRTGSLVMSVDDPDSAPEPTVELPVRRSKRRTARLSASNFDTDWSADAAKPLETVFSAANANTTPLGQRSPRAASPNADALGIEDTLGLLNGLDDKRIEEVVFNTKSNSQFNSQIPFDEIPVGRQVAKEALAKLGQPNISKSRRATKIIKHSGFSADSPSLLDENTAKFYIHLSPPRIFNECKEKKDQASRSRRASYAITDAMPEARADDNTFNTAQDDVTPRAITPDVDEASSSPEDVLNEDGAVMSPANAAEALLSTPSPHVKDPVVSVANEFDADSPHKEPLPRQMEIRCKGSEIKVSVGSRDGGPARTKSKRKDMKKAGKETAATTNADIRPKFKDPFDYSLSETFMDAAKTLSDFKQRLSAEPVAADKQWLSDETFTVGQTDAPLLPSADVELPVTRKEKQSGRKQKANDKKSKKFLTKVNKESTDNCGEPKRGPGRPSRSKAAVESYKKLLDDSFDEISTDSIRDRPARRRRVIDISDDSDSAESVVKGDAQPKQTTSSKSGNTGDSGGITHVARRKAKESSEVKPAKAVKGRKNKKKLKANEDEKQSVLQRSFSKDDVVHLSSKKNVSKSKEKNSKNSVSTKKKRRGVSASVGSSDDEVNSISKVVVLRKSLFESHDSEEFPSNVNSRGQGWRHHSSAAQHSDSSHETTLSDSADKTLVCTDDVDAVLSDVGPQDCAEEKLSSPPKKSRRAACNINFKEPSLGGKLRRGDPGTSNIYGSAPSSAKKSGRKRKQSSSGK